MPEIKSEMVEGDPDPCKEDGDGFDGWWEERTLLEKVLLGILFAIGGIVLIALFGLIIMLLWNWLMPEIFGLPTLDYWKAWGLLILCWILFKNWSFSESNSSTDRKRKKQLRRYMREGQDPPSSPES
jgi:hypothetical protein